MSILTLQNPGTGTNNGFFYSFYKDVGDATMILGAGGQYSTSWTTKTNNLVGGKGWAVGSSHTVSYSGTFAPIGTGYLALYGWTRAPLVEYYILESFGTTNPSKFTKWVASFTTDGGTYDLYRGEQVNRPSIDGIQTFSQFWSVRREKRTSGTITTANHFDAWAKAGLILGTTFDYQILATEGYQSSGSSDITILGAASTLGAEENQGTFCNAEISAGPQDGKSLTLNIAVHNANSWVITLGLNRGQTVQSSNKAVVAGTNGTVTARPNGGGNAFVIKILTDGNKTLPTISCKSS